VSGRNGGRHLTVGPVTERPAIRRLGTQDLDRMHAIELLAYPFPWSRQILLDCIRVGYACFGLQLGTDLAGYTIFNWAAGEAHLLNLCIHPHWQHRGYGSLLLEYTIDRVSKFENEVIFLEVRTSNPGAKSLYEHKGFTVVGRRPAYYKAGEEREDAVLMQMEL